MNRPAAPTHPRRRLLVRAALVPAALVLPAALRAQTAPPAQTTPMPATPIEVWKSPTCGCCKDWIAHLEGHGFRAQVHEVGNTAARARLKIPARLGSCHTARVGGYAIEGHVPAADIRRLLQQRPDAVGLAVPGMPLGSPGMDGPAYGNQQQPYEVLLVAHDGSTRVFNSYFQRPPHQRAG